MQKKRHPRITLSLPSYFLGAVLAPSLAMGGMGCDSPADNGDPVVTSSQALVAAPAMGFAPLTTRKSKVVVGRNGPVRAFDVTIGTTGSYYIRTGGFVPKSTTRLKMFLDDGAAPVGTAAAGADGFNVYDVSANGAVQVKLPSGQHTLSFAGSGANLPELETLEISQSPLPASDAPAKFAEQVRKLQATSLPADYATKKSLESAVVTAEPRNDPKYEYCYDLNAKLNYTFRTSYYFESGTYVVFETRKADPMAADPVLYLFSTSNPQTWTWSDDDSGGGRQSRIAAVIKESGTYVLLVRAYSWSTPNTVDIYKDGSLAFPNVVMAGHTTYCSQGKTNRTLNHFASNTDRSNYKATDTMLWLVDQGGSGIGQVRAFNDDYYQPGDFNWSTNSRIRRDPQPQALWYAIVAAYYSDVPSNATVDIYLDADDSDIMSSFENLKSIDAIKSSSETADYQCIAWSGGLTSKRVWPPTYGSPWYDSDPLVSFDNYYGNKKGSTSVPRYVGAYNYVRDGVTDANAVVDLWALSDGTYKHGSVRKPGDAFAHGYDWESKPGSLTRTFHPRRALRGVSYGDVVKSYRWNGGTAGAVALPTTAGGQPTVDDSIRAGFSVLDTPSLSAAESTKLRSLAAGLSSATISRFESLYAAWKRTWSQPALAVHSNPEMFAGSQEYKELLRFSQEQGKTVWPLIFQKHLADDAWAFVLLEAVTLPTHRDVLGKIAEESAQARFTPDGKYIIPSLDANLTKFIQVLLGSM